MKLEFDNHPAQAQFRGKPVLDDAGKPIPLIDDQWLIRLDDIGVAYCQKAKNGWVSVFNHTLPPTVVKHIKEWVAKQRGDTESAQVEQVPIVPKGEMEDDDE